MSKLLSEAEFLETDTTYNENSELMFNAPVFDYNTMKWAVVAQMRGNKEGANFYKKVFELMFQPILRGHVKIMSPSAPKSPRITLFILCVFST